MCKGNILLQRVPVSDILYVLGMSLFQLISHNISYGLMYFLLYQITISTHLHQQNIIVNTNTFRSICRHLRMLTITTLSASLQQDTSKVIRSNWVHIYSLWM